MNEVEFPTLLSPAQLTERMPVFTLAGLRHVIFHARDNGLAESGALLKCGRKLLIRPDRFLAWLDARNHIALEDGR